MTCIVCKSQALLAWLAGSVSRELRRTSRSCVFYNMGASILIAKGSKILKNAGTMFQNICLNRVLAPETYLDRFLFQNAANYTSQISISVFLDQIRARFHFSSIFYA